MRTIEQVESEIRELNNLKRQLSAQSRMERFKPLVDSVVRDSKSRVVKFDCYTFGNDMEDPIAEALKKESALVFCFGPKGDSGDLRVTITIHRDENE